MANLRIAELDFDEIKANLKEYLKTQNEFADYDFEGSGLSVLLDILSYNTHYNAFLANMLMNEMFLDSAVKRSSVVSLAKHLGYTPRSAQCSSAKLDITVNNPSFSPQFLTLPRYTPFVSTVNNIPYTFLNTEPFTISPSGGVYTFNNIVVKEGKLLSYTYTSASPGPSEKFEIPNELVDISTITVVVQNSTSDVTSTTYVRSTDITDATSTSAIYFIEENSNGRYQIYFGDGNIGRKLSVGNIINIQYIVPSGSGANLSGVIAQTFVCNSTIGGSSSITIDVVNNSSGGSGKEGITSIKYNAPLFYQGRDRAVTKNDYAVLIKSSYPTVESVSVWGGEDSKPPVYGKVFISLKPFTGFTIDDSVKQNITTTLLSKRKMLTIQPEFVDPDYLYLNLDVQVRYNQNNTIKTSGTLTAQVNTSINNYFNNNLQQFDESFYHSRLVGDILKTDTSIVSALVGINIQKRIIPSLNTPNSFIGVNSIKFNNPLHPGELFSTRFYIVVDNVVTTVRIFDVPDVMPPSYSGTGTLKLRELNTLNDILSIGTVNYATGEVSITSLTPVAFPTGQFDIRITASVQEDYYDIVPLKNQIIVLDDSTYSEDIDRKAGVTISTSPLQ